MKKRICLIVTVLCLLFCSVLPTAAQEPSLSVEDSAKLLSAESESRIEAAIRAASAKTDCAFYMATCTLPVGIDRYDYSHRYTGDMFLSGHGLSRGDNIVILIVSKQGDVYYYDLYTYGEALNNISQKEVDYILDFDAVYNNLKSGALADGACVLFEMSAQAYTGRVGASYWIIAIVASIIALAIAGFACGAVYSSYKQKNKSVDYPLDRYATLTLTAEKDSFAGSFVTKRVISSGNSGGGSSHGGGSGHRGGR